METGLTFDKKSFMRDVLESVVKTVEFYGNATVNDMKARTMSRKIANSWVNEVAIDRKGVTLTVGNSHVYAWIVNYGSGSEMDKGTRNKSYSEYVNSGWFNKDRLSRNHEVLSRQEEYTMINYKTGSGTVTKSGSRLTGSNGEALSLERNGRTDGKTDADGQYIAPIRYKAQKPKYFFDNAIELLEKRVETINANGLIQFEKYIKGV